MKDIEPMTLTRRCTFAVAFGALLCAPFAAFAQQAPAAFPRQPMTLIVPFTPGGPVDILGRMLAQEYQARTGQPATVDNRTGGAGNIGIEAVRKSKPDGATLLLIPAGNLTINPTLLKNLSFDVERDFAPITLLATAPNIIVASRKLGASTMAEVIARAKAGRVTYGSPGVGSQLHLTMELVKGIVGGDLVHVPYRGSSQALNDLVGGHVDLLATNITAALGAIKGGTAVPIAMTTAARSDLLPDVPTLEEAGVKGIDVTSWYGMLAPKAIPDATRDAIFAVTRDILTTPAFRERLAAQGLTVVIEEPATLGARIRRETDLWAGVMKKNNIAPQ
jgi:tripartite-type tricarboxylate transporter receptor subunit TctC